MRGVLIQSCARQALCRVFAVLPKLAAKVVPNCVLCLKKTEQIVLRVGIEVGTPTYKQGNLEHLDVGHHHLRAGCTGVIKDTQEPSSPSRNIYEELMSGRQGSRAFKASAILRAHTHTHTHTCTHVPRWRQDRQAHSSMSGPNWGTELLRCAMLC